MLAYPETLDVPSPNHQAEGNEMNDNPPTVNISYATACTAIVTLGIRRANTENAHLIWQIDNAACELVSVTGLQWLYDAAVNNFKKL